MKKLLACGVAAAALVGFSAAHAQVGPAVGGNSSANIIITLGAGGSVTVTDNGFGPYDGVEDTYLGVVNNSGANVGFLDLTGSDIFGFDGDGMCTYNASACSSTDPFGLNRGYAGGGTGLVDTFFSNITDPDHGRVNFSGGLGNGGQAIFSLEEPLTAASFQVTSVGGIPEPATWAMMLMGFFGLGATLRRRREVLA